MCRNLMCGTERKTSPKNKNLFFCTTHKFYEKSNKTQQKKKEEKTFSNIYSMFHITNFSEYIAICTHPKIFTSNKYFNYYIC